MIDDLQYVVLTNSAGGVVHNSFCKTGPGGGVDPSCGKTGKTGKKEIDHSAKVEGEVASGVGGRVVDRDERGKQLPYDVEVQNHRLEVKSFLNGEKHTISVHPDSLLRKVEDAKESKATYHTVVVDERETYEGGGHADKFSGHRVYYKRGSGRYNVSKMHRVKDYDELKALLNTPDKSLPEAAQGRLPKGDELPALRAQAEKAHAARVKKDRTYKQRKRSETMGVNLRIGGGSVPLGSATGVAKLYAWIDQLPEEYSVLQDFITNGSAEESYTIHSELKDALESWPPKDVSVGHTVDELLEVLGDAEPDAFVSVVNEDDDENVTVNEQGRDERGRWVAGTQVSYIGKGNRVEGGWTVVKHGDTSVHITKDGVDKHVNHSALDYEEKTSAPPVVAPKAISTAPGATPEAVLKAAREGKGAKYNFHNMEDLHKAVGGPVEDFHAAVKQLQREGRVSLIATEGRHGTSAEHRASAIHEATGVGSSKTMYGHLSLKSKDS